MKASEFVEGLKKIKIDAGPLKKRGLSDQFIEDFKRAYYAPPTGSNCVSPHPVVELVENYDCSSLEIGMVTFDEKIEETEDYLFFGKADEHDLAIDITTGAVVMVESGFDDILFNCAQNDARFLAAILNIGVFLLRRVFEAGLSENDELNIQMAEEFGDIAGGEKYYDFYKMMLGV
ncbi:hypothetical protein FAZ19_07050 [Sphingobacterium alkalisoli]|uniref:Uncharacterized protein n=1 Tax=Sphingobacterium alkalisoli TaxID=1874115 RepID=A0A4U0H4Y2_9SPHI|nr:hypothetical protein [Sphingobacterium alkalisoli]TJY66668.1 hypothetical protein FAZ19_07050 [Sphingobacterium alkalisoli]GGH14923.1 hypothetical protein GCM10011418_16240 [Sphingobacterium alkalisoli]